MIYVWSVPLKVSGVAKRLRGNWIADTNVIKGHSIDDFTLNELVGGGWGLIGGTSWGDVPEDDILSLAPVFLSLPLGCCGMSSISLHSLPLGQIWLITGPKWWRSSTLDWNLWNHELKQIRSLLSCVLRYLPQLLKSLTAKYRDIKVYIKFIGSEKNMLLFALGWMELQSYMNSQYSNTSSPF